MKINIGKLNIINYDESDKHFKFINKLARDKEVEKYLPMSLEMALLDSRNVEKVEANNSYLIAIGDEPIGFIQIYSNFRNIYSINYGIGRKYRKKGYGTLLLEETSRYLLDNVRCNGVRLSIFDDNIPSNLCALNAGFTLETVVSKCINVYQKIK